MKAFSIRDHDYSYFRQALVGKRLPVAFVDLEHLTTNIAILKQRAGKLPIRLATKSIRSVAVLRRLQSSGAFLRGLLCYSAAEAVWLSELGFDDLLVAYPSVEPADLRAVTMALQKGLSITLMVDSVTHVERLADLAQSAGVVMPVAIDLDVSSDFPKLHFGAYRSPVNGASSALALANEIARRSSLRLDGLMGYESQIAGVMDKVPGQTLRNMALRYLKRRSIAEVKVRRCDTVAALQARGHHLRFVNGGGTGSFESTRCDTSVTELAAGSGLYGPTLFDHYQAFDVLPAAGFALAVTRIPKAGMVTCAGGGYVASGPPGKDRLPQPWLPSGCALIGNEGAGEVQTPVLHPASVTLELGEPVLFRHAKAGELCERFNELLLIEGGRVVDVVTTYRGDGKCFF